MRRLFAALLAALAALQLQIAGERGTARRRHRSGPGEGFACFQFVVGADGLPDPGSLVPLETSYREFAEAGGPSRRVPSSRR